jgi:uncharacterized protein
MNSGLSTGEQLCLACGLCCNGVIFADVQLQPGDDPGALPTRALRGGGLKVNQPCAAFNGACQGYDRRPKHCRDFECVLFKAVTAGMNLDKAQNVIRTAQKRAEKVRKLLGALGEAHEKEALSKRFRRIQRRMENQPADEDSMDLYGQLTLAMQDLNFLLSSDFYPGD